MLDAPLCYCGVIPWSVNTSKVKRDHRLRLDYQPMFYVKSIIAFSSLLFFPLDFLKKCVNNNIITGVIAANVKYFR